MAWTNRTKPTTTFARERSVTVTNWLNRNLYLTTESGLIITTESGIPLTPYGVDNPNWTNRVKP